MAEPRTRLAPIITLLTDHGFAKPVSASGHSSGGAFVSETFRRGALEIGLIIRNRNELGCPNYSYGSGYVGHEDVVAALGRSGAEQLVPGDDLEYKARDRGDAFEALHADFTTIILPALDGSDDQFRAAVDAALKRLRDRRGW